MEAVDDDEPCWSHTESYAPEHMADALENLQATIDDLGPFNCVIGFSQGAAIAISHLLRQQEQDVALSFEFAICFSSVLAVSASPSYGEAAIRKLISRELDFASAIDLGDLAADERALADVITRVLKPAKDHNAMLPDFDLDVYTRGDSTQAPKIMVAALIDKRLAIPTVHMTGKRDAKFMKDMSEVARRLCDEGMMKVLEHPGGHQPPQDSVSIRAAVGAMEWAIIQAQKKK
jgi:pimeloyl-ACP methyl ester carboxylesterase